MGPFMRFVPFDLVSYQPCLPIGCVLVLFTESIFVSLNTSLETNSLKSIFTKQFRIFKGS